MCYCSCVICSIYIFCHNAFIYIFFVVCTLTQIGSTAAVRVFFITSFDLYISLSPFGCLFFRTEPGKIFRSSAGEAQIYFYWNWNIRIFVYMCSSFGCVCVFVPLDKLHSIYNNYISTYIVEMACRFFAVDCLLLFESFYSIFCCSCVHTYTHFRQLLFGSDKFKINTNNFIDGIKQNWLCFSSLRRKRIFPFVFLFHHRILIKKYRLI